MNNLKLYEKFEKYIDGESEKTQFFYIGSNWLWEAMRYFLDPISETLPFTIDQHMDLVKKYIFETKTKLKPIIDRILTNRPDSKFIFDAPAWRLSGDNAMLRNHASDVLDTFLAPFWNKPETLNNLAFYLAGKKNSFSKSFNFPPLWESYKDPRDPAKEYQFNKQYAHPTKFIGGVHYFGSADPLSDGYHKLMQSKPVPIPMSIYLDLNYFFNYFCDTSVLVRKPCCQTSESSKQSEIKL